LARLLAEWQPDVALSGVGGSNLKLAFAAHKARSGAKLVISYHGYSEWRSGKLSLATYAALPWLSRRAARTIAVSGNLRRHLIARWGASSDRTVVIANPVHLPADIRPVADEAALRDRPPVILAVGRLVAEKDYPTLLRAFARIAAARPGAGARLVILGDGPERGRLEDLALSLDIKDAVELAGHRAPWHGYATARCFALSSASEAFGNVLVEALAHGLPVVATRSGGPEEILADGRYGALVRCGDDAALAEALMQALDNPGDPEPRRLRADEFNFERGFAAYLRVVAEAAGMRSAKA